jgi:hypothetical protein
MTSTTDNLAAAFPRPIITPLCGSLSGPTYSTMHAAQLQHNANAASVHSNSGDGIHGHLSFTITAAAYTAIIISQVAFGIPTTPYQYDLQYNIEPSTAIIEVANGVLIQAQQ